MGRTDGLKRRIFLFFICKPIPMWQKVINLDNNAVKMHQQRCTDKEPRQCLLAKTLFLHSSAVSSFFLLRERPVWLWQREGHMWSSQSSLAKKRQEVHCSVKRSPPILTLEVEEAFMWTGSQEKHVAGEALFNFFTLSCFLWSAFWLILSHIHLELKSQTSADFTEDTLSDTSVPWACYATPRLEEEWDSEAY